MSLSPWDLSGRIGFDFSLYRPRRPSYVFATQAARQRNESYRHATKHSNTSSSTGGMEDPGGGPSGEIGTVDYIEGMTRKKRKESYKAACSLRAAEDADVCITFGGPMS